MTANTNPPMEEGDIIICIEKKAFPCHRTVLANSSPYFKAMFDGSFNESNTNRITLKNVDPLAFEEVLKGIYKGEITITSQNACRLLKVCSFLHLSDFEKTCVSFIEKNLLVDNLLEVCHYASFLKEENLFNAIVKYISDHFAQLSKIYDFTSLPLPVFEAILSQENSNRNEDLILLMIAKWVKKNSYKCSTIVEKLLAAAKLTSVNFSALVKLLSDTDDLDEVENKETRAENTLKVTCGLGEPTLKVYLKAKREGILTNNFISLAYTPKSKNKWTLAENFETSYSNLKTVVVGERQFFLSYDRNNNEDSFCQFWMVENKKTIRLREPPLIAKNYELAACDDLIFLYLSGKDVFVNNAASIVGPQSVDCLYFYNCYLDGWKSTPKMKQIVEGASLVGDHTRKCVYLIGGLYEQQYEINVEWVKYPYFQHFGISTANWTAYQCSYFNESKYMFYYGAACLHENYIFLSGSYWNKTFSTVFIKFDIRDPVNQKMTPSGSDFFKYPSRGKNNILISYNNKIYGIDNSQPSPTIETYELQKYTTYSKEEPPLPRKIVSNHILLTSDLTTAAVVTDYYS